MAKGVLKMIVSHRAPSSLNMSSYGAIWTHFRSNFRDFFKKNVLVLDQALVQDLVQVLVQDLVQDGGKKKHGEKKKGRTPPSFYAF